MTNIASESVVTSQCRQNQRAPAVTPQQRDGPTSQAYPRTGTPGQTEDASSDFVMVISNLSVGQKMGLIA